MDVLGIAAIIVQRHGFALHEDVRHLLINALVIIEENVKHTFCRVFEEVGQGFPKRQWLAPIVRV